MTKWYPSLNKLSSDSVSYTCYDFYPIELVVDCEGGMVLSTNEACVTLDDMLVAISAFYTAPKSNVFNSMEIAELPGESGELVITVGGVEADVLRYDLYEVQWVSDAERSTSRCSNLAKLCSGYVARLLEQLNKK